MAAAKVIDLIREEMSPWGFGRSCQQLPIPVIREVLRRLPREHASPERIFLREFVSSTLPGPALKMAWMEALQTLLDLNLSYAWGSKMRKSRLAALAKRPAVVAALQAAVVGTVAPSLDMLAVLAIDSSDASIDALLPKFADEKRQARLEQLATHAAKSPAMEALLAGATRTREAKERASTAVEVIGRIVGDATLQRVKFSISFSSEESETGNVPLVQAHLSVNAAHDAWWSVSMTRVDHRMDMPTTWFSADAMKNDALGLGVATFDHLPQWVAKAAKKLKVTFRSASLSGSLRGKKRDAMTAWLLSA